MGLAQRYRSKNHDDATVGLAVTQFGLSADD